MNANRPRKRRAQSEKSNLRKLLAPAIALICVVAVDQATKSWALGYLSERPPVEILGKFFMLTLVYNEGGAMGTNFGSPTYYLVSSILILLFLLYYIYSHRENQIITVPLSLIAGGAIGNIIDRLQTGQVIDFLDFDFFDIRIFSYELVRWPVFNFADMAISCSIAFLLVKIIFFTPKGPGRGAEITESAQP